MVTVRNALELILKNIHPIEDFEYVFIYDALDRIAWEDIVSPNNIPDFKRSAMDGYGLVGKCQEYRVVQRIKDLDECTSIRINTGFPIPDGVIAVAEVEIVKREGDSIKLIKPVEEKRNFTEVGVELKKGEVILRKGERISVRKRALLAYCGLTTIKVVRKPIVGFLTTGDEVIFPGEEYKKFSVYNANYFILDGLIKKWLGEPIYFGHVFDNIDEIGEKVESMINRCDLIITAGGVSAGSRDFIKNVLQDRFNADVIFDKTTIKPGKPAVFAIIKDKPFFGMPGWPSALYATAYVYLKPMLNKLAGKSKKEFELICKTKEPMKSRQGKYYFNRVKVLFEDGFFKVLSAGSQKTDNFFSTAVADGLVGIDEERGNVEKDQQLPLILFDD